jgi:hypothetical protein
MPPGNPGYDIESVDRDTGSIRYIEVKGIDGIWGERGVGLSRAQYECAREKGNDYWLYVVEHVFGESPSVYRIHNPAGQITQYRFDGNWVGLADKEREETTGDESGEATVEALQSYTENENCRELIARCAQGGFSVPDVGCEVTGENGAVLGDVELAWEDRRLAVALPGTPETVLEALRQDGWEVVILGDLEAAWKAMADRLR